MLTWQGTGGFSLDASVRIHGSDRAGRERLIRYCAGVERVPEDSVFPAPANRRRGFRRWCSGHGNRRLRRARSTAARRILRGSIASVAAGADPAGGLGIEELVALLKGERSG